MIRAFFGFLSSLCPFIKVLFFGDDDRVERCIDSEECETGRPGIPARAAAAAAAALAWMKED